MDADEMRRNGDTEQSIKYWSTLICYWNGEPVLVSAPKPWPVNQEDEE